MTSATNLRHEENERPEPDTAAAVDFLQRFAPEGPWVLAAIPQEGGAPKVNTFDLASLGAMRAWIEQRNGTANLYFAVNPLLRSATKKPSREDVRELAWLHVDIDPRVGEPLEQEQRRIHGHLTTNLPDGVPPPTAIVFSGGGYQAFWRLREPLAINGELALAEQAKQWNLRLELLFGADSTSNVDRIMRLPGTVNVPNESKRKKGRRPVLARLVEFHEDRVYALADFPETRCGTAPTGIPKVEIDAANVRRLASVEALDRWNVPDRVKVIIVQGRHPDEGAKERDDSRSAWLFDSVCNLVRCGVPDNVIYSVITDPDFGVSASVLDKGAGGEKYAIKQITSAREHVAAECDRSSAARPSPLETMDAEGGAPSIVSLAPVDLSQLVTRPWLVDGLLMDGQVTIVAARGGAGKSLFSLHVGVMCATGAEWAYWTAGRRARVLLLNAEDDLDEQRRRLASTCEVMGAAQVQLVDQLMILQARSLVLLHRDPEDDKIKKSALHSQLETILREGSYGLLIVDPLVELHAGLDENSNVDMKELLLCLRDIARRHRIPVLAVHHTRKGAQGGDQDGARGGSSLVNAARVAVTLSPMAEDEAAKLLAQPEQQDRWRYVRVCGAKANYAGRGSDRWLQLVSVQLANGPGGTNGDSSPGLSRWSPAALPENAEAWEQRDEFLSAIEKGPTPGARYSASNKGPRDQRADHLLAARFGFAPARAREMLQRLIEAGWLVERSHVDAQRKTKKRLFSARELLQSEPIPDAELPF